MILSTLAFILRLVARRQSRTKLWWDDYCAGVALVCRIQDSYEQTQSDDVTDLVIRTQLVHGLWQARPTAIITTK